MWQDAFVTMIAVGAVAMLIRRWLKARTRPTTACASCPSAARPAQPPRATP